MQNTTLAEVINELQQQYEAVGNIPVKLLENELSLVLVYDEEPEKELEYVVFTSAGTADLGFENFLLVVDELGHEFKFVDYSLFNKYGAKFHKDEAIKLADELTQNMFVNYKFDIMRINHD